MKFLPPILQLILVLLLLEVLYCFVIISSPLGAIHSFIRWPAFNRGDSNIQSWSRVRVGRNTYLGVQVVDYENISTIIILRFVGSVPASTSPSSSLLPSGGNPIKEIILQSAIIPIRFDAHSKHFFTDRTAHFQSITIRIRFVGLSTVHSSWTGAGCLIAAIVVCLSLLNFTLMSPQIQLNTLDPRRTKID